MLQHLRHDSNLVQLSLRLTNGGFEPKDIDFLEGKPLHYLCLEGNSMPEGVMARIARFIYLGNLDLTRCPVTDDGAAHLRNLRYLSHLSLDGSKVTAAALKNFEPLKKLRFLNLSRTAVIRAGDLVLRYPPRQAGARPLRSHAGAAGCDGVGEPARIAAATEG